MNVKQYGCVLDLQGRRVVVCGGGAVATARLPRLLDAGADVLVVAPTLTPTLQRLHQSARFQWLARLAVEADVLDAALVFVAIDDPTQSARLTRAAHAAGAFVNEASQQSQASLWVPAAIERGPLRMWISSGGSPTLTRAIKSIIERAVPARWGTLAVWFQRWRPLVRQNLDADQRRRFWRHVGAALPEALSWPQAQWIVYIETWLRDHQLTQVVELSDFVVPDDI